MYAWGMVLLLAAGQVWASDLYKCTAADGKVTFQGQPCAAGKETKSAMPAPTTAPGVAPAPPAKLDDIKRQLADVDARLKARTAAEDRQRDADSAAAAAFNEECQRYFDNMWREAPFLTSKSYAAAQSAANEIAIQNRRRLARGCPDQKTR